MADGNVTPPTGSRAAHLITARYERLAVLELFLGWDCSCGIGGPDEASLTLHAHEHGASVRRWLGEYVNGLYREADGGNAAAVVFPLADGNEPPERAAIDKLRAEILEMPTTRWSGEWDRQVPVGLYEWRKAVLTVIDRHRMAL